MQLTNLELVVLFFDFHDYRDVHLHKIVVENEAYFVNMSQENQYTIYQAIFSYDLIFDLEIYAYDRIFYLVTF